MEIKETELDKDLQEELKKLRDDINKLTMIIGQEEVSKRNLEENLNNVNGKIKHYYNLHKKHNAELQSKLNTLEEDYPNGEVDVDKGIIYYQE